MRDMLRCVGDTNYTISQKLKPLGGQVGLPGHEGL